MKFKAMNPLRAKILSAVLAIVTCCILPSALFATPQTKAATTAEQPQQKRFDTSQQAADAMILAVKNDDVAALQEIFGPAGRDFVASGDDVQRQANACLFCCAGRAENARRHRSS